ncbi:MAG: hypothetical protein HUU55_17160 [Myxococcales bacterium]|nr:hypothetical protein [Myxococcales bacterium]
MKKFLFGLLVSGLIGVAGASPASAQETDVKSKFYDFSDQIIDGEIKKPTTLFTDARQKVKFDRLLRLKKSFLPAILETSKESVFK